MIPTVLWLLYDFLSLKNYLNVPSKSNKQKNLKITDENSRIRIRRIHMMDPHPDPLVRDMVPDPSIIKQKY